MQGDAGNTTEEARAAGERSALALCLASCSVVAASLGTPSVPGGTLAWLAFSLAAVSGAHAGLLTVRRRYRHRSQEDLEVSPLPGGLLSGAPASLDPLLPAAWRTQPAADGVVYHRPDGRRFLVAERPVERTAGMPVIVYTPGPFRAPRRDGACWRLQGQPADLTQLLEAL